MDDERVYAAACAHVGADPGRVMKRRIEGDHQVVIIVNNGILGCPKYVIPLSDLDVESLPDGGSGGDVIAEKLAAAIAGDIVTLDEDVYITDEVTLPDGVHLRGAKTGEKTRLYDATPAAIVLADRYGKDLATIHGTGVGGRITKRDVESLTLPNNGEAA